MSLTAITGKNMYLNQAMEQPVKPDFIKAMVKDIATPQDTSTG